jgi:hypothetical protein
VRNQPENKQKAPEELSCPRGLEMFSRKALTEEKQKFFASLKVSSLFRAKSVDVELHVRHEI